jgi:phospholipase/carboxylesterase
MNTTTTISGKTFLPLSGNDARVLIVLLHGYGGNAAGLFRALAPLRTEFPDFAFAIPNGPFPINESTYAWIKLQFPIIMEQVWEGAVLAAPALNNYIDPELSILTLTPDQLILTGFSQGAIMALHIGLLRKIAPLGIIALAGFLAGEKHLCEAISKPPVYIISGYDDAVASPAITTATSLALHDHGIDVHQTLVKGLGRAINDKVITEINKALNSLLTITLPIK